MDNLSSYLAPRPTYRLLFWLLSIALFSGTVWFGFEAFRQFERGERAIVQYENLVAAKAKANAPTLGHLEQEGQKRWAALKVERNFAWEPVFLAVEQTASPDIELLEFRPDKTRRRVEMRGNAKDRKALTSFLAALAEQPSLGKVYLAHQKSVARGGLEAVTFKINATLVEQ